ncbi:nickel/cobalt transporter [Campylobacterota bacterium DY0563]
MQNRINKFLLLILIFTHTLYGCALCTIYSPETRVAVTLNTTQTKIKEAKLLWVLTKEFTQQLETVYDVNQNNYLDKDELIPVEQSLLDYIVPKNYLTHISYDKVINEEKSKPIKIKEYKTFIKNSLLHFEYTIELNYDIVKDNILFINVNDDENYFILLMAENSLKINSPIKIDKEVNRQSVAFYISSASSPQKVIDEKKETNTQNIEDKEKLLKKENVEETLLSKYTKKLKEYLIKIEKGDDFALFSLLLISFLYGIIHALGPGHGKSLAFSYFVSNKSSYTKAFFISQASAFIHIIGALILVVVSVFILESILNNFVNDSVEILTQVSAVLIMILAIYILYNKFNHKSCSCSSCSSTQSSWSTQAPKSTTNLKPNFMKKDLYFVLTAGLIPCPGTVILFIYAFILKTYFAVLLASIFISLGMGLVIFISSFLGVSLQKVSSKSHGITNFLEIASPVVMFVLGILLFLNASMV